jgi:CubicO group peptidase (beta-lactamase class C family)
MRPRPSRWIRRALLAAAVLAGSVALPLAGPVVTPAWAAPVTPAGCVAPTPAALAGFFDAALPGRLAHDRVPGAVVSVVSGDRTVFAKGYGISEAEHGVAFDPARSLVRIASITKPFTWTAVMQQVEAARLDLDADVNTYLKDFKVPATYRRPVTLQTLMNHTSGFEDRVIGIAARSAAEVPPLGDFLAANMPARIRPPGEVTAYSNYGAALAGFIVSQVSGERYDQYVRRHILEPLGMAHSTATEPVPTALAADLARSYDSATNPPKPVPFTLDRLTPDGSVSATAADLARFMLAHLNGGQLAGRRILGPAAEAQMQQSSFAADPRLGGYAHGFMERRINGHRVLMHDGSWEGFESALILIPGCKLGVFVSTNGTGGIDSVIDLIPRFFDRFAPRPAVPDAVAAPAPAPGMAKATLQPGFYEPARHNESTVEKLVNLLGPMRLKVDGDGTVRFKGKQWRPKGGGLYAPADGSDHLVALTGPDGIRYVASDGPTYQLLRPVETPTFNLAVLLVVALAGRRCRPARRRLPGRAGRGGVHRHRRVPLRGAAQLRAAARRAGRGAAGVGGGAGVHGRRLARRRRRRGRPRPPARPARRPGGAGLVPVAVEPDRLAVLVNRGMAPAWTRGGLREGAGRCGDRPARARVPPGHHRRPAAFATDREPGSSTPTRSPPMTSNPTISSMWTLPIGSKASPSSIWSIEATSASSQKTSTRPGPTATTAPAGTGRRRRAPYACYRASLGRNANRPAGSHVGRTLAIFAWTLRVVSCPLDGTYRGQRLRAAMGAKREYWPWKVTVTVSVGPLRCLARIRSASPLRGDSGS